MGKRGPKPRHGGRPIEYNDIYHILHRQRTQQYRERMREQAEHSPSELVTLLETRKNE